MTDLVSVIAKRWKHKGMDCLVLFLSLSPDAVGGWYCGYVGVTSSHPFYKQDYDEELPGCIDIDVHGGVTYSDFLDNIEGIDKQYWYIGFDCNHHGDTDMKVINGELIIVSLRQLDYVVKEVERLVGQMSRWIQWF